MPRMARKIEYPNPFYVILVLVSIAFAVTALGYLVSPGIIDRARTNPARGASPGSIAAANWLDRRGPVALAIEFTIMLVAGVSAMLTDHWFAAKPPVRRNPTNGPA